MPSARGSQSCISAEKTEPTIGLSLAMVLIICCMLARRLAVWRKLRRVAEATSATQTLDGDCEQCHTNVPQTFVIKRYGDAVHWVARLSMLFDATLNPNSELMVSLRSSRRSDKARLEAAHEDMLTFFESIRSDDSIAVGRVFVCSFYTFFFGCARSALGYDNHV